MAFPGSEAVVSQVHSLTIECVDCGRTRIRKPGELRRYGIGADTRLSELAGRLSCAGCREEGLPGKHIAVQASFLEERDRLRAEAYLVNSREALCSEQRARRA